MTRFFKKELNALDAYQCEMNQFGLHVNKTGFGGSYSSDGTAFNLEARTNPTPVKGNKALIEKIEAAGYCVWTWMTKDWETGRRYYVFSVVKIMPIQRDERDAEEYTPYGYVNGKPVDSRDEFIYAKRGRGPIEDDAELISFAEEATSGWHSAGWHHSFTSYYLGDYALDEPYTSLTKKEYSRLQELQSQARIAEKAADDAREWQLKSRTGWADNSVEEVFVDKNGIEKTVMVVAPHGDAC